MTSETRKITRNTKNSTCATPAAVVAILANPKKAATIAIIKNISAE
jgi:hypothetical protein